MESQLRRCTRLPQKVQWVLCLKTCLSACAKWTDLTENNLRYQWSRQGTLEIPRLAFLKAKLDNNSVKISRTEQDVCFDWYLELSKHCREPKFACLQNKILRVTEANALLEKEKTAPAASRLLPQARWWGRSISPGPWPQGSRRLHPPSHLCCLHLFCASFPCANSLIRLALFSETLPTPLFSKLIRAYSL